MLSFLSKFQHSQEMRESKDEILIGELVLAMAKLGCPAIKFHAGDDHQAVTFRPKDDHVLHTITVILDRKTGTSMVQQALIGSKATLTFQAEVKNYLADPDDLLHMYKTDLQNIFKVPLLGDTRLDHQLNSVLATRKRIIDIDDYILKGEASSQRLQELLAATVADLRDKLAQYKKGGATPQAPPPSQPSPQPSAPPSSPPEPGQPQPDEPSTSQGLFKRMSGGN
jgi:hypothetical protein